MGFRLPGLINATQKLRRSSSKGRSTDVPKGYLAVYVGESQMKRVMIPVSYLNHVEFQNFLSHSEEEFGFDHPMGGLTILCREDVFTDLVSRLNGSS
ncbi:auxin-induced protein 15A-like [Rutidosis leptorrhynchoides]|uniref:auxin-induced protein 15A-like n=1 Tax=Rutidosis leptorrhynchoides TaxID=125765 RepID=UPI003A9991A3